VEGRDETEEAQRFSQQEPQNSRASLSAGFFFGIRASNRIVAGGWLAGAASAQTRRQAGRGQGRTILAREAENIAAQLAPNPEPIGDGIAQRLKRRLRGVPSLRARFAFSAQLHDQVPINPTYYCATALPPSHIRILACMAG
jgi:hypothetical protein